MKSLLSSLLFILLFSCSENTTNTNEQITVEQIKSIKIDPILLNETATNINKLRFEFKINGLNQTDIKMNNFVSANWTSDIFGQIVTSKIQTLRFNYFSLSLPTGNHQIKLKVTTLDTIFIDSVNISISDFDDFPILYQDSKWTNYQSILIRHIVVDKNNYKWFGSSGYGVFKYDNIKFKLVNEYNFNTNGEFIIQSFDIQSINLGPNKESVYAGYFTRSYVTKIMNDSTKTYRIDPTNSSNDIHSILVDPNGSFWIGLHDGQFSNYETTNNSLALITNRQQAQINFLTFGKNNNILGSGQFGHLFSYENSNFTELLSGPNFNTVLFDSEGNLWASTSTNGIIKYNGSVEISYNLSNSGIPSNVIRDIELDKLGNLWIATINGIAKFDMQNWTLYNQATSPILSNDIRTIAVDSTNQIWIGTPIGFSVFKAN